MSFVVQMPAEQVNTLTVSLSLQNVPASEAIRYLAIGISNIIHLLNPRAVVIGGGVARAGDVLFTPLRERVRACLMPSFAETFELLPAKLGEDAGVIGAAALWAKRLK